MPLLQRGRKEHKVLSPLSCHTTASTEDSRDFRCGGFLSTSKQEMHPAGHPLGDPSLIQGGIIYLETVPGATGWGLTLPSSRLVASPRWSHLCF